MKEQNRDRTDQDRNNNLEENRQSASNSPKEDNPQQGKEWSNYRTRELSADEETPKENQGRDKE